MNASPRRPWKRALSLLLAGALLLAGLAVVWVWVNSRDLPLPEVADLIPPRTVVADEDNAFVLLVRASEALVWPEDAELDRNNAARALPNNAVALRLARTALACEVCVNPDQGDYGAAGASSKFRHLALLLGAEACAHLAAGQREAARQAVVDGLKLAALVRREPSGLLECLIGESVLDRALAEARHFANDPQVTAAELEAVLAAMRELPSSETSLRRALQGEFVMAEGAVSGLEAGFAAGGAPGVGPRWLAESPARSLLRRYWFHPNRTRRMLAEHFRAMLRDLPLPLEAPVGVPTVRTAPAGFALLAKPNALGELQVSLTAGMIGSPRTYRALSEQRRAGSLLVVALRLFEIRHGRLPGSLDELVPDFLTEVPPSPIDGRPFRYTPAKRLVHATDDISLADPGSGPYDCHDEADVFRIGPPPDGG
jgi:hypothetical protein